METTRTARVKKSVPPWIIEWDFVLFTLNLIWRLLHIVVCFPDSGPPTRAARNSSLSAPSLSRDGPSLAPLQPFCGQTTQCRVAIAGRDLYCTTLMSLIIAGAHYYIISHTCTCACVYIYSHAIIYIYGYTSKRIIANSISTHAILLPIMFLSFDFCYI